MSAKWGPAYWSDLAERVLATLVAALIAMLTADQSGAVSGSPQQWWLLVGLPTVITLLKGVLANLGGAEPSASVAPRAGSAAKEALPPAA